MIEDHVARLRREYEARGLIEDEMAGDPFTQFEEWFAGVIAAGLEEPNTFILATASPGGQPSARAVLMKHLAPAGLVFYTNLESRKSRELEENPLAAATFVWVRLHRQVRFEGPVSLVEPEVADSYFENRPRGAQIAAHASRQSRVVERRSLLDERYREVEARYRGGEIPRPDWWGGWRIRPEIVEFWQGQPNRFHDRVRYLREDAGWRKERLQP